MLIVSAVVAWGLGYWGFTELKANYAASYRALQLFALDGGDVADAPWQLQIARLLAPLVALSAAIGALLALFGAQLQLLKIRFLTRNHTILAGLGSKGSRLAFSLHKAGSNVVVIELDRANGLIEGCRERGISVVQGDARDPSILRKARASHARSAVVLCGDDGTNLEVVAALTASTVFVHLDSLDLRRTLAAESLGAVRSAIELELFNVHDTAAAVLLERFPAGPALLIVGLVGLGESLILRATNRWHTMEPRPAEPLRVTVVDRDAENQVEQLLGRFPELKEVCSIQAVDGDPASPRLDLREKRFSATYVLLESHADGLEAALSLHDRPETRGAPVVLILDSEGGGIADILSERLGSPEGLHTFGVLDRALTPDLLFRGTYELLARARHDDYLRGEDVTPEAAVPWDELDEDYKKSNRHFAADIGRKLAAVGCTVRPSPLAGFGKILDFTEEEVERLGRMEHDRWSTERKLAGWSPTDGERDNTRKLHPLIDKPWEKLSAEDRGKDRDPMRELPRTLARAGFEVFRF